MEEENLFSKLKEVLDILECLEKHHRKLYNSAVDIEDNDISQKTQSDSFLKIRKLKDWKNAVVDLNNTIKDSNIIEIIPSLKIDDEVPHKSITSEKVVDKSKNKSVASQELIGYESEKQIKVGEYVRSKIRVLINNRFTFSDNDIELMQDKEWSKRILGLDCAFIKIYNQDQSITKQTKDELQYNRYWNETFNLGKHNILVTNMWYERNRSSFDSWYDKLYKTNDTKKQNSEDNKKASTYEVGEYTFKDPISIKLFNEVYPITYWNQVLIKVCEIMILRKSYIVAKFDKEPTLNSGQRANFSYKESEIKVNKKKLSNGLWIEANRSANDLVRVSKKILELCGFSEDDLIIHYE